MLIRYWQPNTSIQNVREQLNKVFEELTSTQTSTQSNSGPSWMPTVELAEVGDNLVLKVQLPGVDRKNIDVQVTKEAVCISGDRNLEQKEERSGYFRSEFRYGKFQRVVPLPIPVYNDQVQAEYSDGILTLTLPKVTEARNKVVKINLGELTESPIAPALESSN